jgi:Ca-activated chloride channel homolog
MRSLSVTSLLKRIRPRHARGAIVAGAAAAAFLGFVLEPDPPAPRILTIRYVISPDAEGVLTPLISEFNGQQTKSNGEVIRVTTFPQASGKAAAGIGNRFRPVVWTPASKAWAEMVRESWVDIRVRTLFQSPEVVAVWRTEAQRLHLGSSIRFSELANLISSHELDFGHTDPRISTSGLFAAVSEFSFYSGKRPADLTLEDLSSPRSRESVRNFEWNTAHYVDIARDFADEWCRYGVGFASAAYMQETTLIGFHKRCQTQLIQAVYVTDFPFVADYPYVVLTGPWVSEEEREAAEVFGAWLDGRLAADSNLGESGFRRGNAVPEAASGADPTQPTAPPPPLPDAQLLRAMQDGWAELRRPANVMLVVDESQQMAVGGKEELARRALLRSLDCPGTDPEADDRVGMITFGGGGINSVHTNAPMADFDRSREQIEQGVAALVARGGAALWDAVGRALRAPGLDDPAPVRTIILLANGEDDSSLVNPRELEAELRASVARGRPVQVLLVPYGQNVRSLALLRERLVTPSLGREFKDDVSDTAEVKQFICAFQ